LIIIINGKNMKRTLSGSAKKHKWGFYSGLQKHEEDYVRGVPSLAKGSFAWDFV